MLKLTLTLAIFSSIVIGAPSTFITKMRALVPAASDAKEKSSTLKIDLDNDGKLDTAGYFCAGSKRKECMELAIGIALGNGKSYAYGGSRAFPGKEKRNLLGHPLALAALKAVQKAGCSVKNTGADRLAVLIDGGPAESTLALYWSGKDFDVCSFERPSPILEDSESERPGWIGKIGDQLTKQKKDPSAILIKDPTNVADIDDDLKEDLFFFFENKKKDLGFGVWLSSTDHIELFGAGENALPSSWKSAKASPTLHRAYPHINSLREPEMKCPVKDIPPGYEIHAIEVEISPPDQGRGYLFWWKGEARACSDFRVG